MRFIEFIVELTQEEHDAETRLQNKKWKEEQNAFFAPDASKAKILDYINNKLFHDDLYKKGSKDTNPERIKKRKIFHSFVGKIPLKDIVAMFNAVNNWSTSGYARLNNALRAGKAPPSARIMDLYIEHAPKYKKNVAYRGLPAEFFNTLKAGKTFEDKGYSALSYNADAAEYFATRKTKGGVMEVRGINNMAAIIPAAVWDESEILLPRGTKFKVISIDPPAGRGSPVRKAVVQII